MRQLPEAPARPNHKAHKEAESTNPPAGRTPTGLPEGHRIAPEGSISVRTSLNLVDFDLIMPALLLPLLAEQFHCGLMRVEFAFVLHLKLGDVGVYLRELRSVLWALALYRIDEVCCSL